MQLHCEVVIMDNFTFLLVVFVLPFSCGIAGFMAGYGLSKDERHK